MMENTGNEVLGGAARYARVIGMFAAIFGYAVVLALVVSSNPIFTIMIGRVRDVAWLRVLLIVAEAVCFVVAMARFDEAATGSVPGVALARTAYPLLVVYGFSFLFGIYCTIFEMGVGLDFVDAHFAYLVMVSFVASPVAWLVHLVGYLKAVKLGSVSSDARRLFVEAAIWLVAFSAIVVVRNAHNAYLPTVDEMYESRYGEAFSSSVDNLEHEMEIYAERESMLW